MDNSDAPYLWMRITSWLDVDESGASTALVELKVKLDANHLSVPYDFELNLQPEARGNWQKDEDGVETRRWTHPSVALKKPRGPFFRRTEKQVSAEVPDARVEVYVLALDSDGRRPQLGHAIIAIP